MAEARAALAKLAGPCWEVQVRYGVAGPDRPDRQGRLGPAPMRWRRRSRFTAAATAWAATACAIPPASWPPGRCTGGSAVHRRAGQPGPPARRPGRPRADPAGARPVPPPPGLPTTGKLLGDSELGTPRPVRLTPPMPASTSTCWAPPGRASPP